MASWSLKLGRFFGIDVYIHWTFWILIVWIFLMHLQNGDGVRQGVWAIVFIFSLFACVVLHEFGHALTAKRFSIVTRNITLYPIGGIASLEKMPDKPRQELLVALAGPAVNIVIAGLLYAYLFAAGTLPDAAAVEAVKDITELPFLFTLMSANVLLAVFNLIPAFPMDGGRALRAVLSAAMDRPRATRIAATVGQVMAIFFVFFGFYYNFWLVFIGLFIYLGAGMEAAGEQARSDLSGLSVRDALMLRFTELSPFDTIGTAADALLNSQETEFVVTDRDEPIGLLTKNDIIRGLSERGTEARVSSYMNRDFFIVPPEMMLADFLQQVVSQGVSMAIVMEDGELRGLIDRENVEERLLVERALKRG